MHIKTTVKYCYTFIRMSVVKRTIPSVGEVVEQIFCGNINLYNNLGKLAISTKLKIKISYDPAVQMLLHL